MKKLISLSTLTMAFFLSATAANAAVLVPQGEPFEQGAYQEEAADPYGFNWNQNSPIESTNSNKINWHFDLRYDEPGDWGLKLFRTNPVMAADGTLYINSSGGNLFAFNTDGTVKWKSPNTNFNNVMIAKDGTVINPAGDLRGIDPKDGSVKWSAKTTGTSRINNAVIDKDGLIYTWNGYSSDSFLYVYNPDGTLNYKTTKSLSTYGQQTPDKPMLLGKNGLIYMQSATSSYKYLLAVNKQGEVVWNFRFGFTDGGYTLDKEGNVILSGGNLNNRQEIWRFNKDTGEIMNQKTLVTSSNEIMRHPVVDYSTGDIYQMVDKKLTRLDKDFNVIWSKDFGIGTEVMLDKSHNILFTTSQGMFKINKEGEVIWKLSAADLSITGAISPKILNPLIGPDGRVYVTYGSSRQGETYTRTDIISIGEPVIQWDDTCVNINAVEKKIEDGTLTSSEKEQELAHFKGIVDKLENYTPSN